MGLTKDKNFLTELAAKLSYGGRGRPFLHLEEAEQLAFLQMEEDRDEEEEEEEEGEEESYDSLRPGPSVAEEWDMSATAYVEVVVSDLQRPLPSELFDKLVEFRDLGAPSLGLTLRELIETIAAMAVSLRLGHHNWL